MGQQQDKCSTATTALTTEVRRRLPSPESATTSATSAETVVSRDKHAACIFCKDGIVHSNIYQHLYDCENYNKSVEENKLFYSTCTELKIVNGASVLCGHRCKSRVDFIFHHCHQHKIHYYACVLCDDKLFRDIKKHHVETHVDPVRCPFLCNFTCVDGSGMMYHVRKNHADLLYFPPTVPHTTPGRTPELEEVSPDQIFTNLPTHYQHINNKYFHNIFDSNNGRNILSIGILRKREEGHRIQVSGRRKFKFDKNLHLAQLGDHNASQLQCDATHIEAASHYTYDKEAYEATFLNSNLTFMSREIRKGLWRDVELHENELIKNCDYILHVKGVIYDDEKNIPKVVPGGIKASIPTHHFAVLYITKGKERKCQIFLIPNEIWDYRLTIFHHMCTSEEIETLSGLKFTAEYRSNNSPLE